MSHIPETVFHSSVFIFMQVVGVGGAGSDAVNRMSARQMPGVELYVMNSDAQVSAPALGTKQSPHFPDPC
jgi:hypothetical protein